MSYLVLARKYRPAGFDSVSGQEHVTRTLANAISRDKVGHAYLFSGPRGVGKTSVARIFAKALNCEKGPTPEPCLKCDNCRDITNGTSLAVREIDGASHNSVDNVRELIESFRSLPPTGYRYKIYIIDEIHMLSLAAFNALLKSLEEPPPNTVLIFATTEPQKIPETVLSRCQRHDFRALSAEIIQARLAQIAVSESVKAEPEALRLIARSADGSMRDAQSLLDRVQAFCDGKITEKETSEALGTVDRSVLMRISGAIFSRDIDALLELVAGLRSAGRDPASFLREFTAHWRELFLAKVGGRNALLRDGVSEDDIVELLRQVASPSMLDVQDLYKLAREGADSCLRSSHPTHSFEGLVVRLATREPVTDISELIRRQVFMQPNNGPSGPSGGGVAKRKISGPVHASETVKSSPSQSKLETFSQEKQLDLGDFIRFVSESAGGKVLSEYLKRLEIREFSKTALVGHGQAFEVGGIKKERVKLSKLFKSFLESLGIHVTPEPAIIIEVGIVGKNAGGEMTARKTAKPEMESHPALQSLQKVFPGSKVETVKRNER